jgi:hypothetical protein
MSLGDALAGVEIRIDRERKARSLQEKAILP